MCMYAYVPSGDPSIASNTSCLTTTMRDTPNGLHDKIMKIHLLCHVMSCHVMSCHVMSCHVFLSDGKIMSC